VHDADGDESTTTLTIKIGDVALPATPVAGTVRESGLPGGSTAGSGHAIEGASLGLDDGLTAQARDGEGANGHGTFTVHADGTYSYTLNGRTEDTGTVTDSFTYTARDADGNTVLNTITVTIVDDTPTAIADVGQVSEGAMLTVDA